MKWVFLLGSAEISGGSFVIFEHALRNKKRGADVYIVTENRVEHDTLNWHPEARKLTWMTYDEVKNIKFDIAIATWWKTVFFLHRINAKRYAYFVQSIESWFYPEEDVALRRLVDSTYLLPIPVITEATWIKKYLEENYNRDVSLVLNGVRKDVFTTEGASFSNPDGKFRVLVEGAVNVPFKNVPKTIRLARKSKADEVWLLTNSVVDSYPGVDKLFSKMSIYDCAKIYRSCDVVVKLSYVEGMFGPPLEMFHCGGTAVTYDVRGHDEYIVDGKNAFVVKTDDDERVVERINELYDDKRLLKKLKTAALKTADGWPDWDASSLIFGERINAIMKTPQHITREDLRILTQFYDEFYLTASDSARQAMSLKGVIHNTARKSRTLRKAYGIYTRTRKRQRG